MLFSMPLTLSRVWLPSWWADAHQPSLAVHARPATISSIPAASSNACACMVQVTGTEQGPDWSSTHSAYEWATSMLDNHLDGLDASLGSIRQPASTTQVRAHILQSIFSGLHLLEHWCTGAANAPAHTNSFGVAALLYKRETDSWPLGWPGCISGLRWAACSSSDAGAGSYDRRRKGPFEGFSICLSTGAANAPRHTNFLNLWVFDFF